MAKISLRAYNREIEGLIEHGQQLDEAIAHCRHILKSYPKHLETYRLLGKAYLEAKRYDQAVDIFQRVLVAVPDDFVSHVGMSIIADDKGKLDDAIWHMERAFEVQPSNAAIQGELQRLFGRRDGLEPPKIRLTRGALAHMYVQGELYNQAISEIRAVLSNDPKRTDLQTLLARAYFRNGQKAEATDLCTELLSHYPYCLDANRLMVEILPGTQRADSVQEYRQRVNELDPYAAFVQDSVFRSESVADNLVSLERLEYTGENTESLGTLGIGLETDMTLTGRASGHAAESPRPPAAPAPRGASAGDLPAWLRGAPDEAGQNAAAPVAAPAVNANDLPDFLRQAGWDAASGDAVPQAPPAVAEQPADELPGGAAVEGDLPDWVKALAPADASQPRSEAAPASADTPDWLRNLGAEEPLQPSSVQETPPPAGDSPMPSAETPDWLKNLGGRELDEPAAPQAAQSDSDWLGSLRSEQASVPPPAAASEESPDWLRDFSNDLETPVMKSASPTPAAPQPLNLEPSANLGALGTTAQEQDDAMAWLEGLAAKHGAKPEELVTDPNARTEVAPDWVDRAKEMGEQSGEQAQASSDDETGMWLRGLEADATESSAFPETALGEPVEPGPADFRSGFADQNEFAATGAAPEKDELRGAGQEETPGWLGDFTPMPSTPLADDAPDWLRGISEGPVEPEQHLVEPPHGANAPTTRLPKLPTATGGLPAEEPHWEGKTGALPPWLAGLDKEEPILPPGGAGGQSSEDLPSWLQSEAEPEPEAKEPANPADWRPVQPEPYNVRQPTVTASTSAEGPVLPQPEPRRIERAPVPSPIPARPKPTSVAPKPAAASLGDAQAQLGRGNIAAALDIYTRLIRKGKSLEDIIRDLRDALYRYPVEVPLWQSLGDAYMRANRLQEALDAYTKAEELLR